MALGRELGWVAARAGVRADFFHIATFLHRIPESTRILNFSMALGPLQRIFLKAEEQTCFIFSSDQSLSHV